MAEQKDKIRLDKWLWAARFFKTRSLAAEAVTGGKVHLNNARTKPARELQIGDRLTIRRGPYEWTVVVCKLAIRRGPASEAVQLYEETDESRRRRDEAVAEIRAQQWRPSERGGRPSKKDRRDLTRFRGR